MTPIQRFLTTETLSRRMKNKMQWVRRIFCFFGFHNYLSIRKEWFMYRQSDRFIDVVNQEYLKQGEDITTVIWCPHCKKRIEIKVNI